MLPLRILPLVTLALFLSATAEAAGTSSTAVSSTRAVGQPELGGPKAAVVGDRLDDVLRGADKTGTPPGPNPAASLPPPSAEPGEKRPLPDYDRREPEPPNAATVLVWVPRVVFYPLHLVLDWGVRRPIVGGIALAEKYYLFKRLERLFSFRDGKTVVYPTFLSDFGLNPSIGISATNEDLFFDGNSLSTSLSFWDDRWIRAAAKNETTFFADDTGRVTLTGELVTRPDMPFYGIGPRTQTTDESFYRIRKTELGASLSGLFSPLSRITFGTKFRDVRFDERAQAPFIGDEIDTRGLPGFDRGRYQLFDTKLLAEIDTRDPDTQFAGGSGVRFELFGSFAIDPTNKARNFARWGAEAAAFLDVGGAHVLGLSVYGEAIEHTGGDPVPFTELPALGGLETMRGYFPRRFVGDSTFTAAFSYRYPVWSLLDAEVFLALGNAFLDHWDDFKLRRLYLNSGVSLRTNLARDTGLTMLFALGTNRLDEPNFKVDSVRFTFGVVQGF